ncbi:hypothetical protein C8R45DRAFT_940467 [Mycena sanguinolenta]|nr:hypothetical protein C8R45DRAFT_940467 [Mycena sanguinolenta]
MASKKNKQTTKLLAALVSVIPEWDRMARSLNRSTEFTLTPTSSCSEHSNFRTWLMATDLRPYARETAIVSALAKSLSLETLVIGTGSIILEYLRQLVDLPSLRSINFTVFRHVKWNPSTTVALQFIRKAANADSKLKALVSYHELE